MQPLPLFGRRICRHKTHGGLGQTQSVEKSKESHDRHAEGKDSQRLGAQHSRQVDLEQISCRRGKQGSRKKDRRMPRDAPHLAAKLRCGPACGRSLRRLDD